MYIYGQHNPCKSFSQFRLTGFVLVLPTDDLTEYKVSQLKEKQRSIQTYPKLVTRSVMDTYKSTKW